MDTDLPLLIGEDQENDALFLREALRTNGIETPLHICTDGVEVVDYLEGKGRFQDREKYPYPSLIILDLQMPRMSGLDVLRWLQEHPKFQIIPAVMLSSSAHQRDVGQAYDLGASSYLVKPDTLDDLANLIAVIWRFWALCERFRLSRDVAGRRRFL